MSSTSKEQKEEDAQEGEIDLKKNSEEEISKKEDQFDHDYPITIIPELIYLSFIVEKIGFIMLFIIGLYFTYDSPTNFARMFFFYVIIVFIYLVYKHDPLFLRTRVSQKKKE